MAQIHARHDQQAEALHMLAAAACLGGHRTRAWLEIARIAQRLGPQGQSLYRFAHHEASRIRATRNQGADEDGQPGAGSVQLGGVEVPDP
jgi:hypothetical protein